MKSVYVTSHVRGFLEDLFKTDFKEIEFIYNDKNVYEVISRRRKFISKIVRSKFLDYFGFYQEMHVKEKCDLAFSYNRFIKRGVDYVLYLENPLALVHYSTTRAKSPVTKIRLKKSFNNSNLKAIVCMSEACKDMLLKIYDIPDKLKIKVIYPLVTDNAIPVSNTECGLKCLFIASQFELKGGREIIETFSKLSEMGSEAKLKIITPISLLKKSYLDRISTLANVELVDFNLSKKELNNLYIDNDVLINPSRQDSFGLVLLEGLAYGNILIATDLFAVSEMIEPHQNGYLLEPKYRFYTKGKMPNESVWNDRKSTIHSDYLDLKMVEDLQSYITRIEDNKDFERLKINSYNLYKTRFHHELIKRQWDNLFWEIFE